GPEVYPDPCGPQKLDLHAMQGIPRLRSHSAWLTPPWTSALEVATISLENHDDFEELSMMRNVSALFRHVRQLATMLISFIVAAICSLGLCLRPSPALAAENLFLRKQLALYEERQVKPRRATNAMRLAMVWLSYWFAWRSALRIVQPE